MAEIMYEHVTVDGPVINVPDKLVVQPKPEDLETVVGVELASWPDIGEGMVAESQKFATRLELGIMNMLYLKGIPVGIISFQNPTFTNSATLHELLKDFQGKGVLEWEDVVSNYGLPNDWYQATNNGNIVQQGHSTHDPDSDCVFLIGVGVDASVKGQGLVNHLIDYTLKQARAAGKKFAIGYGRLPQLHENFTFSSITPQKALGHLMKKKPGTDLPADYGARFHVNNGASTVAVIPNVMDDPESLGFGFLALYDLRK